MGFGFTDLMSAEGRSDDILRPGGPVAQPSPCAESIAIPSGSNDTHTGMPDEPSSSDGSLTRGDFAARMKATNIPDNWEEDFQREPLQSVRLDDMIRERTPEEVQK